MCTEVFAGELGLPLFVVKLDRLISSYLGETASNVRKIFEFARKQPCILFLDEFDALARARDDATEHNELRRVVNSLLIFIDRIKPKGFLIAATNLDKALDPAVWRRFDEVVWFEKPDREMIEQFLTLKFKNVQTTFNPLSRAGELEGYSYAEIERICVQTIKSAVIERRKDIREQDLRQAIADEIRRFAKSTRSGVGFAVTQTGGNPTRNVSADRAPIGARNSKPEELGFVPADQISTKSLFVGVCSNTDLVCPYGGRTRSLLSLNDCRPFGRGPDGGVRECLWARRQSTSRR